MASSPISPCHSLWLSSARCDRWLRKSVKIPKKISNRFILHFSFDYENVDDIGLSGVGAEWIHGFSLSSSIPIYLETGLKFIYAYKSEDYAELEVDDEENIWIFEGKNTINVMNIAVPVNLAYRFYLPNKPFPGIIIARQGLAGSEEQSGCCVRIRYDDILPQGRTRVEIWCVPVSVSNKKKQHLWWWRQPPTLHPSWVAQRPWRLQYSSTAMTLSPQVQMSAAGRSVRVTKRPPCSVTT